MRPHRGTLIESAFQTLRDQLLLACLDIVGAAGAALNGAPQPAAAPPSRDGAVGEDAARDGAARCKPAGGAVH